MVRGVVIHPLYRIPCLTCALYQPPPPPTPPSHIVSISCVRDALFISVHPSRIHHNIKPPSTLATPLKFTAHTHDMMAQGHLVWVWQEQASKQQQQHNPFSHPRIKCSGGQAGGRGGATTTTTEHGRLWHQPPSSSIADMTFCFYCTHEERNRNLLLQKRSRTHQPRPSRAGQVQSAAGSASAGLEFCNGVFCLMVILRRWRYSLCVEAAVVAAAAKHHTT